MGRHAEQSPVTIPLQESIEFFHEPGLALRIVLGDVLQITAHEDQAPGAKLAFAGGNARLRALDLALESFFPEALGFQQLFFLRLEFLLQGLLPVQKLLEFFLWVHCFGW